jgi:hypothetical protein
MFVIYKGQKSLRFLADEAVEHAIGRSIEIVPLFVTHDDANDVLAQCQGLFDMDDSVANTLRIVEVTRFAGDDNDSGPIDSDWTPGK